MMATGKYGLAAGDSGRPANADWTVPQRWADYAAGEHAVWRTLYERQAGLMHGRACDEFVAGMQALPIVADRIPDFERMSEVLMRHTGWQIVAVPGLVPDEVFFEHLAHRRFPSGRFIRRAGQLDYLEEPDVFHDVFGHAPMLMNPVLADFIQAYGEGGLRIYGSGIASSRAESVFALDDDSPHRIGFDLERVMRTRYRIDDFQECYFVLNALDDLLELAHVDFAPAYERVQRQDEIEPSRLLPSDRVITCGSGRYHAARRAGARHAI